MDCSAAKRMLREGGEAVGSSAGQPSLQEHLDGCAGCRRHAEAAERMGGCLTKLDLLAESLPEPAVAETKRRILQAVRDQGAGTLEAGFEGWLARFPLLAWGSGVAAGAMLTFALSLLFGHLRSGGTVASTADTTPVEVEAAREPGQRPARAESVSERLTLAGLSKDFEQQKASREGVSRAFARKLAAFIANTASGMEERLKATDLLVQSYDGMGEHDLARVSYEKYLDLLERRVGRQKAAEEAQRKADRIFYREKDYLRALGYHDLILTRYADLEQAHQSRFMVGMYYHRQELLPEALEAYRLAAEEAPSSPWAKRARQEVWVVLANMGRREEAVAALQQFAADYQGEEEAGYALFHMGCLHYMTGVSRYPDAIREFKALLSEHPGHRYASSAQRMLTRIRANVTKDLSPGEMLN